MMRMGPEAAMVKSKMDPRAELARIARTDYRIVDVRALYARLPIEAEYLPPTRSPAQRFLRWGQHWLRRGGAPANGGPLAAAPAMARPPEGREVRCAGLAAMPAALARAGPERPAAPISGLPLPP
jgi:hypothetical protein